MNTKFLDKIIDKLIDETIITGIEPEYIYSWNPMPPPHVSPYSLKSRHVAYFINHLRTIYGISDYDEFVYIWDNYRSRLNTNELSHFWSKQYIDENKNNTIKEQINISNEDREFMFRAYKEMGLDEEWAQYDLEELLKWLDTLPEKIILYRLLYIDDDNIINREELGDHYTQEKESLLHNHYSKGSIYGGHWGNPVLLTVEADKDQIDILNTLHNNILYPHEEEITLKNKGRGIKIKGVEKI